jgi:pimeloyl-ACP methyl ester carboxylesterase
VPSGPSLTRAALLGASASAVSGCGVARALAHFGSRGCPPAVFSPSDFQAGMSVRIVRGEIRSAFARGETVRYAIAIPPGASGEAVAYVLPGRGSTAHDALVLTGLQIALGAWVRDGHRPFALAALDAGESYFHARRSGEDRLTVATRSLPAVVARALRRTPSREALIGFSMGGYGALLAAENDPGRYAAVAVAGPAIFPSYEDESRSVGDAFDDAADFARNDVVARAAGLAGTPVLIECGRDDPFLPGVRRFQRAAPRAGVRVQPGGHDDCFWRAAAAPLVAFVGARM